MAWQSCMHYAQATHIKTFSFDPARQRTQCRFVHTHGVSCSKADDRGWGVESYLRNDREIEAAGKTLALIRRALAKVSGGQRLCIPSRIGHKRLLYRLQPVRWLGLLELTIRLV